MVRQELKSQEEIFEDEVAKAQGKDLAQWRSYVAWEKERYKTNGFLWAIGNKNSHTIKGKHTTFWEEGHADGLKSLRLKEAKTKISHWSVTPEQAETIMAEF